jgi:hypothetical protein
MAWTSVIFMVGMEWDEGVARAIACDTTRRIGATATVSAPPVLCCGAQAHQYFLSPGAGQARRPDADLQRAGGRDTVRSGTIKPRFV